MTDSEIAVSNAAEFSVTELSNALRRTLEENFGYVRVRGEISGYRGPSGSGHVYFALKDAGARLDAVIWRGAFQRMRVKPEEGLEVIATGRITAYAGKSSYQIIVDSIEPAGIGALMALLDARRRKLEAEGLFDSARKKRLPFLPRVIGVVTSPTGAVIRDILHRLSDRFPVHVVVWPVRVQGETAAAEVAAAIRGFGALEKDGPVPIPDVLIVARGGGSLEDLWSFNEEIVVRAAAESRIPLISAVGHETDTTLIDYAADVRAPTPSAAAELAVPVRAELLAKLASLDGRGQGAMLRLSQRRLSELRALTRALPSGEALLARLRQRLDFAAQALNSLSRAAFHARAIAIERISRRLSAQSPRARTAATREKLGALGGRLFRAATGFVLRDRQGLTLVVAARTRETARDVARRGDNFGALSRRFLALGAARDRAARERASRLAAAGERLSRAMRQNLQRRADRLSSHAKLLEAVGYHSVLARGFALVRDAAGAPLRRAAEVPKGAALSLEFADGKVAATAAGGGRKRSRGGRGEAEGQGTLL